MTGLKTCLDEALKQPHIPSTWASHLHTHLQITSVSKAAAGDSLVMGITSGVFAICETLWLRGWVKQLSRNFFSEKAAEKNASYAMLFSESSFLP